MEMHLLMLSSVNSILSMIDLKAEREVISNRWNREPCSTTPSSRLTFEKGVFGGVTPFKDRQFPPPHFLMCYILLLKQRLDNKQRVADRCLRCLGVSNRVIHPERFQRAQDSPYSDWMIGHKPVLEIGGSNA